MTWQEKLLNLESINLLDYVDEVPDFKELKKCKQDNGWHAEGDVLNHTNLVLAKTREICLKELSQRPFEQIVLYLAALLHDFGKPYTTFYNDKKSRLVAYSHEQVGVSYAREFLRIYFPLIDSHMREKILSLVEFHGHPKRMIQMKSEDKRFKRLSCEVNTELVYYLEIADFTGRQGKASKDALEYLEQFKKKCQELNIWGTSFKIDSNVIRWNIFYGNFHEDNKQQIKKFLAKFKDKKPFDLVFTIGAPASGKTTYLNSKYSDFKFISMDEERLKVCGNMGDMSRNREVYETCFRELSKILKAQKSAVWDATSTTRKERKRLIQLARSTGARITIIYFDLPLEEHFQRNEKRDRHVPEHIIEMFYRRIQFPKEYEYDNLVVVSEKKQEAYISI